MQNMAIPGRKHTGRAKRARRGPETSISPRDYAERPTELKIDMETLLLLPRETEQHLVRRARLGKRAPCPIPRAQRRAACASLQVTAAVASPSHSRLPARPRSPEPPAPTAGFPPLPVPKAFPERG